eukprot:jgi/Botrbrau1/7800/Bobra.0159s0228.1
MSCRILTFERPVLFTHHRRRLGVTRVRRALPNKDSWSPDEEQPAESKEKEISIEEVLSEAKSLGEDFVFVDKGDDNAVWDLEERITAEPLENVADLPEPRHVLDPEQVDILSAYSPEQGFREVAVQDLKARLDAKEAVLVLDVRGEADFADGSIPGARNISMDTLSERVRAGALDDFRNGPVAVLCGTGRLSSQATVRLQKVLGFGGP